VSTPAAAETRRKSLREFRETSATLFCKNNTPTKITCNTPDGKINFELEPAGYDDSIRILPKECLAMPGLQRLWMKKAITISDDESMEDEIVLLMGGQVELSSGPRPVQVMGEDGKMQTITPTLEKAPETRDVHMVVDNDPTSRTYGQASTPKCIVGGEPIFQTVEQIRAGAPPLCAGHQGEAPRVVSTPQPDGTWTHRLGNPAVIEPTRRLPD
jgi:hypothetical protein